jgi:sortase (surface protein transpeptidase)
MRPGSKNQRLGKRQPASRGLSLPPVQKSSRRRRVKRLYLPFSFSSQLRISFRRFRTKKERRSKRYKQVVFKLYFSSYREVAIAKVRRRRPRSYYYERRKTFLLLPRRTLGTILFLGIIVNGAAFFSLHLNKAGSTKIISNNSVSATPIAQPKTPPPPKTMAHSEPTRIRIPAINVDTELTPVGLQADKSIQTPSNFDIAGWYNGSPTPGELGPSVIVGHVDSVDGIAVFFRLRELKVDDVIQVDRTDGTTANFKVTDVKQLPQDSFPTQQVYGNINYAGIRLITCGGTFNTMTHEYGDNTVVYGVLQ